MGIVIAKFRKKKSTYDVLDKLENEIKSIGEFKKNTEETQKKIVRRFLLLGALVYIIVIVIWYFYFNYFTVNQKLLCVLPLILFPLIIWCIKRILTWYYNRKIRRNQNKLASLKEQKKKIIDNVMETETYKVAKTILDKFANDKKPEATPSKALTPVVQKSVNPGDTVLRQRYVPQTRGRLSFGGALTPMPSKEMSMSSGLSVKPQQMPMVKSVSNVVATPGFPGTPLPPLPRGILPRDRTVLDKMVDYLVGDGPANRYALICKQCSSHNGMALKEEFEYLSFKCCYCSAFNPARKKKPTAPKLQFDSTLSVTQHEVSDTSDSEKNSNSSDNDEPQPIIQEPEMDSPDSGVDKISDSDLKGSDTESTPMDVDENKEGTVTSNANKDSLDNGDHSNK